MAGHRPIRKPDAKRDPSLLPARVVHPPTRRVADKPPLDNPSPPQRTVADEDLDFDVHLGKL